MIQAAFTTRQPVPDVIYSYWFPREIFRRLSHHSLVPRRHWWRSRLPVKFLMHQMWSFGPLYEGVGPGCGNLGFMTYFRNYSLNATGLNESVDEESFQEYFAKYLKVTLMQYKY
mmetsp:Transcript_77345/g.174941  ORF Transcript_77345/g.174941 Transcript_77345/m.174941 type:complete len:114 (-) Transcript_77345:46-387(-)